MKTYTEQQILDDDYFNDDFGIYGGILYKLTDAENQWVDFVRGRYSIADYIDQNTDADTGLTLFDSYGITIERGFSAALDDDCKGAGKAVCLSDDTALQKIFFYGYQESEGE